MILKESRGRKKCLRTLPNDFSTIYVKPVKDNLNVGTWLKPRTTTPEGFNLYVYCYTWIHLVIKLKITEI